MEAAEPGVRHDELDGFVLPEIRARIEQRYWLPIQHASTAEVFLDDPTFFVDPAGHPGTYSDHAVVHVRDVSRRSARLAREQDGVLLPPRSADRLGTVQGAAVLMAYLHDIGMVAATPDGRRVHAQFAAQTALDPTFDDIAEDLWRSDAGGLRTRITDVGLDTGRVPGEIVLREILAMTVCHSKSAVPAALLDDPGALRALMLRATFTTLERQMHADRSALWTEPRDPAAASVATRRYHDVDEDAFRWLVDPDPGVRELALDVVDGIRILRAADALRQRGTTQRTSAGYEVCVDRRSGTGVIAVRSADNRFAALMWSDKHHSIAEGNLRVVELTPDGALRVAFHRGSFDGDGATDRVVAATAETVADIEADALGSFRPPAGAATLAVEIAAPHDGPAFATALGELLVRRVPELEGRIVVVDDEPPSHTHSEPAAWLRRATPVSSGQHDVEAWFAALARHGMRVAAIDRREALRDAHVVRLRTGEVVLSANTAASAVLVPFGHGLRVQPLGGYEAQPLHPWLPIGVTGVVRGAERNAAVVADADVDVLVIPAERYLSHWFHPFTPDELRHAWTVWHADGGADTG